MVGLCACLFGTYLGCTPDNRYKVLSVFFDGVPDPNAPPKTSTFASKRNGTVAGGLKPKNVRVSIHTPFKEEKCSSCHSDTAAAEIYASALDSKLCIKCHTDVPVAYPVMHGPVAVKACLWCHQPHDSAYPHLLRTTGTALCLQCHDREVLSSRSPGHRSEGTDCLECHVAHGSPDRFLLRHKGIAPPATQPAPATRPASTDRQIARNSGSG